MSKTLILFCIFVTLSFSNAFSQQSKSKNYSGDKRKEEKVKLEQPLLKTGSSIISHQGYTLSFNTATNCADWVAWELTDYEVKTKKASRSNDFRSDEKAPLRHRVEPYDYKGSGYDRGHMCPAGDMAWDYTAMSECFYMTNICPQNCDLNQKWWEHLESACRRWALRESRIYICCGPIYYDSPKKPKHIGNNLKVRVPDAFFKVVLSLKKNEEKAIGFIYKNDSSRQTMEETAVSVDYVESVTKLDFFYNLDNNIERKVEAQYNLKAWR